MQKWQESVKKDLGLVVTSTAFSAAFNQVPFHKLPDLVSRLSGLPQGKEGQDQGRGDKVDQSASVDLPEDLVKLLDVVAEGDIIVGESGTATKVGIEDVGTGLEHHHPDVQHLFGLLDPTLQLQLQLLALGLADQVQPFPVVGV